MSTEAVERLLAGPKMQRRMSIARIRRRTDSLVLELELKIGGTITEAQRVLCTHLASLTEAAERIARTDPAALSRISSTASRISAQLGLVYPVAAPPPRGPVTLEEYIAHKRLGDTDAHAVLHAEDTDEAEDDLPAQPLRLAAVVPADDEADEEFEKRQQQRRKARRQAKREDTKRQRRRAVRRVQR